MEILPLLRAWMVLCSIIASTTSTTTLCTEHSTAIIDCDNLRLATLPPIVQTGLKWMDVWDETNITTTREPVLVLRAAGNELSQVSNTSAWLD